jgi:hypothetical protein
MPQNESQQNSMARIAEIGGLNIDPLLIHRRYGSPPRRYRSPMRFERPRFSSRRGDSAPRSGPKPGDPDSRNSGPEQPKRDPENAPPSDPVAKSKSLPPKNGSQPDEEERKKREEKEEQKRLEFEERLRRLPTPGEDGSFFFSFTFFYSFFLFFFLLLSFILSFFFSSEKLGRVNDKNIFFCCKKRSSLCTSFLM